MKVLELFAGSRSMGKEAERLGYEVFSVDWEDFEGIDLCIDIGELKISDVPFVPDIIWASPDCTTYTLMAGGTHRLKPNYAPKTDYAKKCDSVNLHWLGLIKEWQKLNPNLVYYIENPRMMLRKMWFMQEHPIRNTVWYCQYGDTRAKPTDIWTNNAAWKSRPECHNFKKDKKTGEVIKHCHHESAPRGARTGTQGKKNAYERSKVPQELCHEILTADIKVVDYAKKSLFDT